MDLVMEQGCAMNSVVEQGCGMEKEDFCFFK